MPIEDFKTGEHIGLMKKVRLSEKLTRSEKFFDIIQEEEKKNPEDSSQIRVG